MDVLRRRVTALVLAGIVAGCGASSTAPAGPPGASGGDACSTKSSAALEAVSRTRDANRACGSDADCVVVAFSASCFDACTRVVASSGKAAYEKAIGDANAGDCAAFHAARCPAPMSPPCAPPQPPRCTNGACS